MTEQMQTQETAGPELENGELTDSELALVVGGGDGGPGGPTDGTSAVQKVREAA